MTPVICQFDDVLPPHLIARMLSQADFRDELNPADGVTYRGIAVNIPPEVVHLIEHQIRAILDVRQFVVNHMFLRLMTKNMPPSNIHTDHQMGEFSMHVYLSRTGYRWGTQFWCHDDFGLAFPRVIDRLPQDMIRRLGDPTAWTKTEFVEAKYNRALIHDSRLWHSAVPATGFGDTRDDGRLVLTTFFSRSET